jgi:hypothetical protein
MSTDFVRRLFANEPGVVVFHRQHQHVESIELYESEGQSQNESAIDSLLAKSK